MDTLFLATIVPGLPAATALASVLYFVSRSRRYGGKRTRATRSERLSGLRGLAHE